MAIYAMSTRVARLKGIGTNPLRWAGIRGIRVARFTMGAIILGEGSTLHGGMHAHDEANFGWGQFGEVVFVHGEHSVAYATGNLERALPRQSSISIAALEVGHSDDKEDAHPGESDRNRYDVLRK